MSHAITNREDKGASLPAIFEQFVVSAFVLSVLQQVIALWCYRDIGQESPKTRSLPSRYHPVDVNYTA